MNKINTLKELVSNFHYIDKISITTVKGSVSTTSKKGYHFYSNYAVNVSFYSFNGDINWLNANLVRWLRINEPEKSIGEMFKFDVKIIDQDLFDVTYEINLTEKIFVEEDEDFLKISMQDIDQHIDVIKELTTKHLQNLKNSVKNDKE